MPLLWDTRIRQANVRQRLRVIGLPRAAIYAIGCVTHARDAVRSCGPSLHSTFERASDVLDRFWSDYPSSLECSNLMANRDLVVSLLPDDERRLSEYLSGEDTLMDGIVYAFSSAIMPSYNEATEEQVVNALDRAYMFVYIFHHELDQFPQTEDEIRAIESHSQFCLGEIRFQVSLLSLIESMEGLPPSYSEMCRVVL